MQIGSVPTDYSSVHAPQGSPPPPPPANTQSVSPHHHEKDGDKDGGGPASADGTTGQQINVTA